MAPTRTPRSQIPLRVLECVARPARTYAPLSFVKSLTFAFIGFLAVNALPTLSADAQPDQKSSASESDLLKDVKVPAGFDATIFAAPPMANYPVFIAAAPDGTLFKNFPDEIIQPLRISDDDPVIAHTAVEALKRMNAAEVCWSIVDSSEARKARRSIARLARNSSRQCRRRLTDRLQEEKRSEFQTNYAPATIARGHKVLEIDLPMDSVMVTDIRASLPSRDDVSHGDQQFGRRVEGSNFIWGEETKPMASDLPDVRKTPA